MSELKQVSVTRNESSVNFNPTAYQRGDKAKAGAMFLAIDDKLTTQELIKFVGEDETKSILYARVNLLSQRWTEAASTGSNEKGEDVPKDFDEAEFIKYASEFSARGLSKDELQAAIKAGTDELHSVLMDTTVAYADKEQRIIQLANRIKGLNADLAGRKREKAEPAEAATA